MWGGRGAIVRPREAEWSWQLAAVCWICYSKNILKDPNDEDVSVVYNKDSLFVSLYLSFFSLVIALSTMLTALQCSISVVVL